MTRTARHRYPSEPRRRRIPTRLLAAAAATVLLVSLGSSSRAALKPPAGAKAKAKAQQQPVLADGQLVVKLARGASIDAVNGALGSRTASVLLASHRIYLLDVPLTGEGGKPADAWKAQADRIVHQFEHDPAVIYAEPNLALNAPEADRLHLWPSGPAACIGSDPAQFTGQPAAVDLNLAAVHGVATGAGQVVAVLDSGVELRHPALAGRIAPGGYDYVDDDPVPDTVGDDAGSNHGTFVAGIVALVAPDARILPERVLDRGGSGNVFVVAEAIFDAAAAGARVINLSFGTSDKIDSKVLTDALAAAQHAGAVVIGAAGNDASTSQHYPAAAAGVVSVAATDGSENSLARFSDHGGWIDLAAPGVDIVSALPCGYGRWSGTSMAAPFVSGEAALVRQAFGLTKGNEVADRLLKGVVKLPGKGVHSGAIDIYRAVTHH